MTSLTMAVSTVVSSPDPGPTLKRVGSGDETILTDKWQKAVVKINLDDCLCSINRKLLCLTTKFHGDKQIHDHMKQRCHEMYIKAMVM